MKEVINLIEMSYKEFNDIIYYLIDGEAYFVAKNLIEKIGYRKGYSDVVKQQCDNNDFFLYDKNSKYQDFDYKKLGQRGGYLVNEKGAFDLIYKNEKLSIREKEGLIKLFNKNGFFKNVSLYERKEIRFVDKLSLALQPFNIIGIPQFPILNYRIDFYIPKLKLAIEYDEKEHKYYTYEKQELRQYQIENYLRCKFFRLSDENSDYYNIGLVISRIVKMNENIVA